MAVTVAPREPVDRQDTATALDASLALELFVEAGLTVSAMRKAGKSAGLVTEEGQGAWGLLKLLDEHGPHTVPALARRRGHSRQYMQGLVDRMCEKGFIDLVENPAHKRSRKAALTPHGREALARMTQEAAAMALATLADCPPRAVALARDVLRLARRRLGG